MEFKWTLDNGKIVNAEELTVVELDGKEYLVFSIDYTKDCFDLEACYVEKDGRGNNKLRRIDKPEDYRKIHQWIDAQVAEYDHMMEGEEEEMKLWQYTGSPGSFMEQNYEAFILGPMLHGQTSVTEEDTYHSIHKPSGIFSYEIKGKLEGSGTRWLQLPKTIDMKTNFGMTIPVNVSIVKTLTGEKASARTGNSNLYKYYNIKCTFSWSEDICRKLQKLAMEKAEHIFSSRKDVLQNIYHHVLEASRIGAKVYIGKTCVSADNHRWDYASVGLKELNTIQIYGLALALEKYMQQTGTRRTFTRLTVYSGMIEFWLERTPGLEEW